MEKKPIEMGKKYRTRDGREVRVLCIDRNNGVFSVVALVGGREYVEAFTKFGEYWGDGHASNNDLVEVSPFEDFKIDDPVMVRFCDGGWYRRYFAGVSEDGEALAWDNGGTSWSSDKVYDKSAWPQCRKPTAEELAGKT